MDIGDHITATRYIGAGTELYRYEPGNGTAYEIIVTPVVGASTYGVLGSVSRGWLIINGLNGKAYLFQKHGSIDRYYVAEKLFNPKSSVTDIDHITALIGYVTNRPVLGDKQEG